MARVACCRRLSLVVGRKCVRWSYMCALNVARALFRTGLSSHRCQVDLRKRLPNVTRATLRETPVDLSWAYCGPT